MKKSNKRYLLASVWSGAVLVGVAAALYAKIVNYAQDLFNQQFVAHGWISLLVSPFLFLIATATVRKLAPEAKGSGIPQVIQAIDQEHHSHGSDIAKNSKLISLRTACVKVASSLVGLLGGASIGREGPTVQIAASIFASISRLTKRFDPMVELPSYLTAGAAAGVAAAFNTPLAGITFVIEELLDGALGNFRQSIMLSVIIAGMTAQALLGDYLYFGHPETSTPDLSVAYQTLLISACAGIMGGVFAKLLAHPKVSRLPSHWAWRALICGILCSALCYLSNGSTTGSGYEPTQKFLEATTIDFVPLLFPIYKLAATVLSYLSGMAGGIFSPSLSIGAGIGISMAKLFHFANFKTCALIGMVAFFSGAVQAPLTAVIIVMEMTDRHVLIIPFMAAAFIGQGIGRKFMPMPIYAFLARNNV